MKIFPNFWLTLYRIYTSIYNIRNLYEFEKKSLSDNSVSSCLKGMIGGNTSLSPKIPNTRFFKHSFDFWAIYEVFAGNDMF